MNHSRMVRSYSKKELIEIQVPSITGVCQSVKSQIKDIWDIWNQIASNLGHNRDADEWLIDFWQNKPLIRCTLIHLMEILCSSWFSFDYINGISFVKSWNLQKWGGMIFRLATFVWLKISLKHTRFWAQALLSRSRSKLI